MGTLNAHQKRHGHAMTTQQAAESGHLIAFNWQGGGKQTSLGFDPESDVTSALHVGQVPAVSGMHVRRLMPVECERLQGFPDDWTRWGHDGREISDSARYRMCGNAVAVPCVEWIGRRIVEALTKHEPDNQQGA